VRPWALVDKSELLPDKSIVYSMHVGRQALHDFVRPQVGARYPQMYVCSTARWIRGSSTTIAVIPS
jgi:hypothetical protein